MMGEKLIISVKEAEVLIHKGSLVLNRKELTAVKDEYRVRIVLNTVSGLMQNDKSVILYSDVIQFEIYDIDEIAFLNHYRVPSGLLKVSTRTPKNIKAKKGDNKLSLDKEELLFINDGYMKLRNGLIGMLHNKYEIQLILSSDIQIELTMQSFLKLSPIRKQLITELLDKEQFPIANLTGKVVSEIYKQIAWWGKFVKENYLNTLGIKDEARIKEIRVWLGGFLKIDEVNFLNQQLTQIPEEVKEEVDFLVGYCLAASFINSYQDDRFFFINQYEALVYVNKNELYNWVSFFVSFFKEDMHQLYFVSSLIPQISKLERMAFELSQNKLEIVENEFYNFELNEIKREKLIAEYIELRKGEVNKKLEIINLKEAKNIFSNNLFKDKLPLVGLHVKSKYDGNTIIPNTCTFFEESVGLKFNRSGSSNIVFYLDKSNDLKELEKILKLHKFKVEPITKLIDKRKKVLLVFNKNNHLSPFISLYAELLNGLKGVSKIKKAVVVFLASSKMDDIRSIEFNQLVTQQKRNFAQFLGVDVEVIVKDILSLDDTEVKRNLKNALKDYKINEIEVVDENFDSIKASWILDINSEYFVEIEKQNYYSFFN